MRPHVYVIAGPNGAGKTTFAWKFLPGHANCRNFLNADLIAEGVSPFTPESVAFRAGRLMLEEIELHARRGEDFGFETTLAGRITSGCFMISQSVGTRWICSFSGCPQLILQ